MIRSDVLIIGAGPTGLVLALGLTKLRACDQPHPTLSRSTKTCRTTQPGVVAF